MPVFKYDELKRDPVQMEGVDKTTMSIVIGKNEGWKENVLRVFRIEPGGFTPHHQHDWEHVNYVIKGKGTLTIGDQTKEIAAGDFAFVPPNNLHQFRNPGSEPLEFICIIPNLEQYKK